MDEIVESLKDKIYAGRNISRDEACILINADLQKLCQAANEIREHFCGNRFDMCTIINGKNGHCTENCKFCAQSSHYHTFIEEYPLLKADEIVNQALYNAERGVLRFAVVTSGRALNDAEVDKMCEAIMEIRRQSDIKICVSFGLLNKEQFLKLKAAGASRVHNNLETSRDNYKSVCTTHSFDEKIKTINAAKEAGMTVCSGGIMGLGESMEDRIDMVCEIRGMGIKSVPVNMLNPIPGTPYENNRILSNEEMCRIVAIIRFLIPDGYIRLAGGRGLLPDMGRKCFMSGANAAISGDMLTTSGITIENDMKMLKEIGYEVRL